MNAVTSQPYDVLIMGAGFAGLCQARHLLMKDPELKVALIDPKGTGKAGRDLKVGESLVEISAMFLYRELELHEYLVENHPPKFGLNFHWPKQIDKTETLEDYYHVWTNGNPELPSFQLNRAKFEADLLDMNIEMGVTYIHGKVVDTEINPRGELNKATVKSAEGGEFVLSAHHLIDASGRKFLLGKKLDNIFFEKEKLAGLDTGSAWLRVDNIDRDIFQKRRDEINGSGCHYYGTNHWFGHGHWIWQIPIETESRTLSIGVVHHKDKIDGKTLNTRDKFLAFLKSNHRIVYDMVQSGEAVDFKYLPRIAHGSKKMISRDQWYVIGEAANMYDPFYSTGLVLASFNIECATEVILSERRGEPDIDDIYEEFDRFMLIASTTYNHVFKDHSKHLGDAAAMSWRTYAESIFWFGILVPMYTGKWHLERDFIAQFSSISDRFFLDDDSILVTLYNELTAAQQKGKNLGLMNYTVTTQLPFGYNPLKTWDTYRQNSKYEKRRLNVMKGIKMSNFFLALLFIKLRYKSSGFFGIFHPRILRVLGELSWWSIKAAFGEMAHKWEVRNRPLNSKMDREFRMFMDEYHYASECVPWDEEGESSSAKDSPSFDTKHSGADVTAVR